MGIETILVYWSNADPLPKFEESLHIKCGPNQRHYLEIANMRYEGTLADLEEVLYQWAIDEGWFS